MLLRSAFLARGRMGSTRVSGRRAPWLSAARLMSSGRDDLRSGRDEVGSGRDVVVESNCWKCGETAGHNNAFCATCGTIQPPPTEKDPFVLFGIEERFAINVDELEKTYWAMQKKLHPDRFGNKAEEEQIHSRDYSSALNEAYETLRSPLLRAQAILQRKGIDALGESSGTSQSDPQILLHAMEQRELLESCDDRASLHKLLASASAQVAAEESSLAAAFASQNSQLASRALVNLKYALKLREEISDKISQTYK